MRRYALRIDLGGGSTWGCTRVRLESCVRETLRRCRLPSLTTTSPNAAVPSGLFSRWRAPSRALPYSRPCTTPAEHFQDAELRWLYEHCSALVAAGCEDCWLTPLEAATFGRPSAVLDRGDSLETMTSETAEFFDEPRPQPVVVAVREALRRSWNAAAIPRRAADFDEAHLATRLRCILEEAWSESAHSAASRR